jgi:hypothetical protein
MPSDQPGVMLRCVAGGMRGLVQAVASGCKLCAAAVPHGIHDEGNQMKRPLRATVLSISLFVLEPGGAVADFYAAPDAPPSGSCTDPATPCDLGFLMGLAKGLDFRIHLTAGTYAPRYTGTNSMTLIGAGPETTSIGSAGSLCAITLQGNALAISDVTIAGGFAGGHKGICLTAPDAAATVLTLARSVVRLGPNNGAGIEATTSGTGTAVINIVDSWFDRNGGGALVFSGAGTVSIDRSLITGNSHLQTIAPALSFSGAVSATISNSTVADNPGRGIQHTAGLLRLNNVTLAGNNESGGEQLLAQSAFINHSIVKGACTGTGLAGNYSVESPGNSCSLGIGSRASVLPEQLKLGPLADNGGPTKSMMPQPGSVAVGLGGDGCALVDQRNRARNGACDAGAIQANAADR